MKYLQLYLYEESIIIDYYIKHFEKCYIKSSGDSRSEEQGGQSSRMNVGLRQICWHNKEHNGLVYYASIMLACWVDNIKYRSILSNRTVGVSTLVNYRSIVSNRTVTVKLSRGAMAPLGPPLESPMIKSHHRYIGEYIIYDPIYSKGAAIH